jgi:CHASE2 domain-containing sensor protein
MAVLTFNAIAAGEYVLKIVFIGYTKYQQQDLMYTGSRQLVIDSIQFNGRQETVE